MRGYFSITRKRAAALNAFGKQVLEIGCGTGMRLRMFQDYGWAVAGIETSQWAYQYAKLQSLDVVHCWLEEANFGGRKFDLAFFRGNIGELASPIDAIERLHGLLQRNAPVCVLGEPVIPPDDPEPGRLFVSPPNAIKALFCDRKFTFEAEEYDEGHATIWFRSRLR